MIAAMVFMMLCGMITVAAIKGWYDKPTETSMQVLDKTGIVTVERHGVAYEVTVGMSVRNQDLYRTSAESKLLIGTAENEKICLESNSKLQILETDEGMEFEILQGTVVTGNIENNRQNGETQEEPSDEQGMFCTIAIVCHTILENQEKLIPEKEGYVPADGVILAETKAAFEEGETVFDLLKRVCEEEQIPLEYSYTPVYESYYIEGINHLYEFDCGSQSGWMYKVNDVFPNYGCSNYALSEGDTVVWGYTCNGIGADVENMKVE